jgi:hypothetical protein
MPRKCQVKRKRQVHRQHTEEKKLRSVRSVHSVLLVQLCARQCCSAAVRNGVGVLEGHTSPSAIQKYRNVSVLM